MPVDGLALLGGERRLLPGAVPRDAVQVDAEGLASVARSLESGRWSMFTSDEVEAFEEEFAEYVGARFVILLNSCTTALLASLRAAGVESGDNVAVPSYTYVGTCMPLRELDAIPVWLDVSATSGNAEPGALADAAEYMGLKAAILPLLFGSCAGIEQVAAIAADRGARVIFDCAQFLGDRAVTARLVRLGPCCFSFGESKILRLGEGGAVATNDQEFAEAVRRYRHEGESWTNMGVSRISLSRVAPLDVVTALASTQRGLNLRPQAYLAALGRAQLRGVAAFLAATSRNAIALSRSISADTVLRKPESRAAWWTFPCIVGDGVKRDTLLAALLAEGVPAGVHFPRLIPEHPVFGGLSDQSCRMRFPNAKRFSEQHIVLPIYPRISEEVALEIGNVVQAVVQDSSLLSKSADTAATEFLASARLDDLSSGLYMFLTEHRRDAASVYSE